MSTYVLQNQYRAASSEEAQMIAAAIRRSGGPMLPPDKELSLSNIALLMEEAQKAWTEGTPGPSSAQVERLHREIQEHAAQDLLGETAAHPARSRVCATQPENFHTGV